MRTTGRVRVWGRDGRTELERDIVNCSHCEAPIELEPITRKPAGDFAYCDHCHAYVCPTLACLRCDPFERQIERRLSAQYHREQFARLAGLEG